jgi:hypothetical protein
MHQGLSTARTQPSCRKVLNSPTNGQDIHIEEPYFSFDHRKKHYATEMSVNYHERLYGHSLSLIPLRLGAFC